MLLKTKKVEIEIQVKSKLAQRFEEKICEEDESLLTVVPAKAMAKDKIKFMATMLNTFQADKEKLPIEDDDKYDMYDFIDDWCEENEKSITDLYVMFLEQLDVKGIIDRGMGFTMGKLIKDSMKKAMEQIEEQAKEGIKI